MGAMIGYPNDFPKQITIAEDPVVDCASGPCPGGFGSQYWRVNEWHVGISLGGSSGSCLLNEDHQLVGVLSGGVGTNCADFSWDEFSKISSEWSNLQPFLDPNNSGVLSIPGTAGLGGACDAGRTGEVQSGRGGGQGKRRRLGMERGWGPGCRLGAEQWRVRGARKRRL